MKKPFSTIHVLTGISMAAMLLVGCQDFLVQKEDGGTPAATSESARAAEAAKDAENVDTLKVVASAAVDTAVCDSLSKAIASYFVKDDIYISMLQNYAKLCPTPPPQLPPNFSFCTYVQNKMKSESYIGADISQWERLYKDSCLSYDPGPVSAPPETTKTDYPQDLPLQVADTSVCDSLLQAIKSYPVKDDHLYALSQNYAKLCPSPPPVPPADYSLCGDLLDKMSSPYHSESKLATYKQMYSDSCANYNPKPVQVMPETTMTDYPKSLPAPAKDTVLCADILAQIHAATVKDDAYMALQDRFKAEGCYTAPVTSPPVPIEVICKELHAKLAGLVPGTPEHTAYLKDFNYQCNGKYPAPEAAPIALPATAKDSALCSDIMAQIQATIIKDDAYIALWTRYNAEGCSPPPVPVTTRFDEATCKDLQAKMAGAVSGTPEHASYYKDFTHMCSWMSAAK